MLDASDNCPNNANPGQQDADADGTGDVCDPTPNGPPADPGAATRAAGADHDTA